uniref:Plasmid stabilization system protein ParE n=1 Tax=Candidatus Kentrum sp. LPFa TaxID=2126335 RepID=A0A450WWG4_9GAMM|nr:MAG: Plasmid stabilization system protein ParE [Candidatus Kentron sp. LPFa]VFK34713.1 MAG: Plasmid stabilization system protein ParE [Candidatus Kentron sp. LPFa]
MVIWSLPARNDLKAIHDYIAKDSPFYAKKTVQDIRERTDALDELPRKGRRAPELNEDTARELGLYSYRILYEIESDDLIEVLAVIHKRRDVEVEDVPRDQ